MLEEVLQKRKYRNSYRIKARNKSNRPMLTVYKSNQNIYAQIVEADGKILTTFSTKSKDAQDQIKSKTGIEKAYEVGKGIAKKALESGITEVVFNRGPYLYIGRVKSLATGARDGGLHF